MQRCCLPNAGQAGSPSQREPTSLPNAAGTSHETCWGAGKNTAEAGPWRRRAAEPLRSACLDSPPSQGPRDSLEPQHLDSGGREAEADQRCP